jgi:hypothetical protein
MVMHAPGAYTPGLDVCGNCGRWTDGAALRQACARAGQPARWTTCPGCGQRLPGRDLVPDPAGSALKCPGCGEGASRAGVAEATW